MMPTASFFGERSFSISDQERFARCSGDYNPIHLDQVYARRCLTGGIVVHGIHTLLWALDCWAKVFVSAQRPAKGIRRLKAQFLRPLLMECQVVCRGSVSDDGEVRLEVTASGEQVLLAEFIESQGNPEWTNHLPKDERIFNKAPAVHSLASISDMSGRLHLENPAELRALFPNLCGGQSGNWPVFLAHTSRLIGMECPGLYSLYSDLELEMTAQDVCEWSQNFTYRVVRVDNRFRLATIAVEGVGIKGMVQAFVRPSHIQQPGIDVLSPLVPVARFGGQRALVVGGSRGLGELTSKLLAAGGADVCLTYRQGRDDAEAIVAEICKYGGSARTVHFDVDADTKIGTIFRGEWCPTHLYYFATPFIFTGARTSFSARAMERFTSAYVTAFFKIVEELYRLGGLRSVLYPSSTALEEFPSDMAEYCAAKAAGEAVCQVLMHRHRNLHIQCTRFPRLKTDQTATLAWANNLDPVPALLIALSSLSGPH